VGQEDQIAPWQDNSMGRIALMTWIGLIMLGATGCMTGPIQDNPMFIHPDPSVHVENPVWVPNGHVAYGEVFEKTLDIVSDYFEIRFANRYDGRIDTLPRISPGYEQFWKPGSPDSYQRLEATLQTMRHRGEVTIEPAPDGGFFVKVIVYKELEDLDRPIRSTAGAATFQTLNPIDRQYQVIDPSVYEASWIPRGRDTELEQLILQRLKSCM
jgi:hypothetical protein